MHPEYINTARLEISMHKLLSDNGVRAEVGEWQSIVGGVTGNTIEVQDVSFQSFIPEDIVELQTTVRPNLPWAEEHFMERVSGLPLNPPPSSARWPFTQRGHAEHVNFAGRFSHTYPERLWPCRIPYEMYTSEMYGIRSRYGDLADVVTLLTKRRHTRQAFIPIWFPEDTGAVDGQRVPCTLGYHIMIRGHALKIVYYIRSCDLLRHFIDDVYMAMRLAQWIAERINVFEANQPSPQLVVAERLVMHISSLHIFDVDKPSLAMRYAKLQRIARDGK